MKRWIPSVNAFWEWNTGLHALIFASKRHMHDDCCPMQQLKARLSLLFFRSLTWTDCCGNLVLQTFLRILKNAINCMSSHHNYFRVVWKDAWHAWYQRLQMCPLQQLKARLSFTLLWGFDLCRTLRKVGFADFFQNFETAIDWMSSHHHCFQVVRKDAWNADTSVCNCAIWTRFTSLVPSAVVCF